MDNRIHNHKKTAIYCRVSTFDQEKGLRSQEQALKDYCDSHGLNEVIWYRDEISGSMTKRPAFEKLQRDIFSGKVGTVVCWKLDRLSRSTKDGINLLCDWIAKGIRVIAITQQLDFSGAVGQMVASVLFAVAQMERENLRENTKRGIAAAKAKGIRLGKRPKLLAKDIVPMLQAGLKIADVARRFNKSRQAVYDALKRDKVDLAQIPR